MIVKDHPQKPFANLFQIPHSFPFDGRREWDVRETMRHPQHIQQSSHYTWLVNVIDNILQLLINGVTSYL